MRKFTIYILLAAVLCPSAHSISQEVRFVTPTRYTQSDGLTSYYTTKIIKDSFGFLWIGTQEGLNLFDGNNFQAFTKRSPEKKRLKGSLVSDLIEDKKRNWIWVLLSYGEVCAIDITTRIVTTRISLDTSNPASVKWKRCLAMQGDILWIGGYDFVKPYHIEKKEFLPIDIKAKCKISKEELNISMICFDQQQRMLVFADGHGMLVLDKNYNHVQTFNEPLLGAKGIKPKLRFWDAVMSNNLLCVASSWGLQMFDTETGSPLLKKLKTNESTLTQSELLSIAASSDTTLLFSTHLGIYELNIQTFKVTSYHDVNPDNDLLTSTFDIFYDKNTHQAWLGTLAGVASFHTQTTHFRPFSKAGKVKLKHLFSILPVSENIIYCGDESGLYYVDINTNEITKIDNTGSALMLFKDVSGNILTSNKKGMHILTGKKVTPAGAVFPALKQLDTDHLSCAIQYNDSLVLFGSIIQKGLTVWNTRTGTLKNYRQYSAHNLIDGLTIINNLYKSQSGEVMILTEKSIIAFNPLTGYHTTHTIMDSETKEISSNFMDMCEINNDYYISTYGDGLLHVDKHFSIKKKIRAEDGLNNTCVYRVFPYKQSIIATTNDGIALINLNPFKVKNYFQTDGLHSNAFEQLCGFQDDHRILAGGIDGFTIINPSLLPHNTHAPDLYFKNLKVTSDSGTSDTCHITMLEMTIPTDVLQTTISFSALNYTNPKGITYAYKINELNSTWIDLGKQNFVDLIGFSPGEYSLEVRSSNEDGVWNKKPLALKLIYLPKWYQTNIFGFFVTLMLALFAYALLRFRIEQSKKQQQIRRDIGNDLHDDIGSTLNTLKIFTHLAIREPQNKTHLAQIEESITQATVGLRDMIWVLEDSEDSIFELMKRIKKFALPICVAHNIKLKTDIESDENPKALLKTVKRNLLLIAKETINNSIKYSNCQNIQILIIQSRQELKLKISDDGIGFDLHQIKYGKGLESIHYRARQIFFTFEIYSSPRKGTVIELYKKNSKRLLF